MAGRLRPSTACRPSRLALATREREREAVVANLVGLLAGA